MSVFVDTSALHVLLDRDDENYGAARAAFSSLLESEELVAHDDLLVETIAVTPRRLGVEAVRVLARGLLPALTTVWVDELMRERGLARAFVFEDDFRDAGLPLP